MTFVTSALHAVMADPRCRLAVIVHGGAFSIPDEIAEACAKGCVLAAKEAYEILRCGRSAIDAGVTWDWALSVSQYCPYLRHVWALHFRRNTCHFGGPA